MHTYIAAYVEYSIEALMFQHNDGHIIYLKDTV